MGSTLVKAVREILVKVSPGVNFINVLGAAFMCTDPESANKCDSLVSTQQCRFTLLGPTSVKAASKMMVKVSPRISDAVLSGHLTPVARGETTSLF